MLQQVSEPIPINRLESASASWGWECDWCMKECDDGTEPYSVYLNDDASVQDLHVAFDNFDCVCAACYMGMMNAAVQSKLSFIEERKQEARASCLRNKRIQAKPPTIPPKQSILQESMVMDALTSMSHEMVDPEALKQLFQSAPVVVSATSKDVA